MFQRIIVPLDGSPGAEHAIPVAARLACKAGGSLVFLHVVVPAHAGKGTDAQFPRKILLAEALEREMIDAASYITQISARYAEDLAGISVEMEAIVGAVPPVLSVTACAEQSDLIVMCRQREAGMDQWGLESVVQQIMRHSPVPLLVWNSQQQALPVLEATSPLRILVPLDGSLFAETALVPALQLLSQYAGPGPRELCLVSVINLLVSEGTEEEEAHISPYVTVQARQSARRYLQAVSRRLRIRPGYKQDIQITELVTSGVDIAHAIIGFTEQSANPASSLIAIATHGREGIKRLVSGSIAERLLNAAVVPLLVVSPGAGMSMSSLIDFALPVQGRQEERRGAGVAFKQK